MPIGTTAFLLATLGGGAISGLGQYLGGQQQAGALSSAQSAAERASRRQNRLSQRLLALQEQLIAENAPIRDAFRQASLASIGFLGREAEAAPLTSPAAQLGLARGSEALAQQVGAFGGSADSSVFGRGLGDLVGQLTAADVQRQTDIRRFLAGLGTQTGTQGLAGAIGGQAAQAGGQASNLLSQSLQAMISGGGAQGAGTASALGTAGSALGALPAQFSQYQFLQSLLGGGGGGGGAGRTQRLTAPGIQEMVDRQNILANQNAPASMFGGAPQLIGFPPIPRQRRF
jgi:hypothetical protein